jgi:hypothetical protein
MRRWIPLGSLFLGILTIGFGLAAAAGEAGTLSVGKINPLTGRFAAHGTALHQGIQLAVKEAKAGGTLRVTLATRDYEGKSERAVAAAEELVTRLRTTVGAVPGAEVRVTSKHQHQDAGLPASLLAYLPRWFNHIDLKANAELYVRVPAWLAGRLGGRPE